MVFSYQRPSALGVAVAVCNVLFLHCSMGGGRGLYGVPPALGYLDLLVHFLLSGYLVYRMRTVHNGSVAAKALWAMSAFMGSFPVARQCLFYMNRM